jgi:CRP/FNR family transcriptional regulator, cyclic AMP receptor protein
VDLAGLAGLEEGTRRRLAEGAQRRRYRRGEVVFHEGDAANCMHLLVSGHVSVGVTTPLGDSAVFTVLGPGALFGELALLVGSAVRSATVNALDAVETLWFSRDRVALLRRTDPALDRFLVGLLADYLTRQDARLLEALYVPVEKRVLRRLLALARLYGNGDAGTVVPLTQDVLAGVAGSTRPTTNQVLRGAEAAGLVSLARGSVRIVDPAGLARRAR